MTPRETFDFIAMTIRRYFDAGNYSLMAQPMAVLADYLDRLGHHEAAATISGFATTPFARTISPKLEKRSPTCARLSATTTYESFAARRGHDQRRHGDLRARADRPRPRRFAHW